VPGNFGLERDIKKRIEWWNKLKSQISKQKTVRSRDSGIRRAEAKSKSQSLKGKTEK